MFQKLSIFSIISFPVYQTASEWHSFSSFQFNEPSCGAERNSVTRGGGGAVHGHSRGVSAEATQARQYCDSTRHNPHQRNTHLCLRICRE